MITAEASVPHGPAVYAGRFARRGHDLGPVVRDAALHEAGRWEALGAARAATLPPRSQGRARARYRAVA